MNHRIEYIDIAKGITILLVIIGHVSHLHGVIQGSIYSFHMPLFFILSGYFLKNEPVKESAKRMLPTIIIPYLVVGVLMRVIKMVQDLYCGNPFDVQDILSLFGVCWKFGGDIVSVGAIWFLMVLFWAKLIVQYLMTKPYGIPCLLVLATGSILITLKLNVVLPFGIQQALVCAIFVYIGLLSNRKKIFDVKLSNLLVLGLFISTLPFMMKVGVATRANKYSLGIISVLISSYISWLVILGIKRLFESKFYMTEKIKPFFIWCGRLSLVVLAVHSVEARYFAFNSPNFVIESLGRLTVILSLTWLCTKFTLTRKLFHIK